MPGGSSPGKIIEGLAAHIGKPDDHLEGFRVFTFDDLAPTEAWRQEMLTDLA